MAAAATNNHRHDARALFETLLRRAFGAESMSVPDFFNFLRESLRLGTGVSLPFGVFCVFSLMG